MYSHRFSSCLHANISSSTGFLAISDHIKWQCVRKTVLITGVSTVKCIWSSLFFLSDWPTSCVLPEYCVYCLCIVSFSTKHPGYVLLLLDLLSHSARLVYNRAVTEVSMGHKLIFMSMSVCIKGLDRKKVVSCTDAVPWPNWADAISKRRSHHIWGNIPLPQCFLGTSCLAMMCLQAEVHIWAGSVESKISSQLSVPVCSYSFFSIFKFLFGFTAEFAMKTCWYLGPPSSIEYFRSVGSCSVHCRSQSEAICEWLVPLQLLTVHKLGLKRLIQWYLHHLTSWLRQGFFLSFTQMEKEKITLLLRADDFI